MIYFEIFEYWCLKPLPRRWCLNLTDELSAIGTLICYDFLTAEEIGQEMGGN